MATALPSLQQFGLLNRDSSRKEVTDTVSLLVADLKATVAKTNKPGAARKSVADLLNFLHSLDSTVHPGRSPLAQAISTDILPLLYEEEKEPDTYKFLKAEQAFANHVGVIIKRALDFLRAETPDHPAYGKEKATGNIPALCVFDEKFAIGMQEFVAAAIKARLRVKRIETNIYRPLLNDYIKADYNPIDFFDQNSDYISEQICEIFDWGYKTRGGITERAKQQKETGGGGSDYSPEEAICQELLDKLKLHSEQNDYFLPQCAGFRFFKSLMKLDQPRFITSFNTITNAMVYGENHDYIVRQVDRLTKTLDTFEFDLVALCHFNLGDKKERLTFRAMQDSCIGSARERSRMMVNRPLIAAEIGRRPVHLAKEICTQVDDKRGGIKAIRPYLEEFAASISQTNKIRFEPEIKACAGMFLSQKPLRVLANWIDKEGADESLKFMRVQQVETELKKKWEKG